MDSSVKYLAAPVGKNDDDDVFSSIVENDVHPFTTSTHEVNFITEKREEKRDDNNLPKPTPQKVGRRVLLVDGTYIPYTFLSLTHTYIHKNVEICYLIAANLSKYLTLIEPVPYRTSTH